MTQQVRVHVMPKLHVVRLHRDTHPLVTPHPWGVGVERGYGLLDGPWGIVEIGEAPRVRRFQWWQGRLLLL